MELKIWLQSVDQWFKKWFHVWTLQLGKHLHQRRNAVMQLTVSRQRIQSVCAISFNRLIRVALKARAWVFRKISFFNSLLFVTSTAPTFPTVPVSLIFPFFIVNCYKSKTDLILPDKLMSYMHDIIHIGLSCTSYSPSLTIMVTIFFFCYTIMVPIYGFMHILLHCSLKKKKKHILLHKTMIGHYC